MTLAKLCLKKTFRRASDLTFHLGRLSQTAYANASNVSFLDVLTRTSNSTKKDKLKSRKV